MSSLCYPWLQLKNLLSMAAAEKNVELIFHMQPDLPELYMGDIGRMRQIITNVFGNAVKFTHEGHVFISVEGEQTGDSAELVIKIEDTGIGIPQSKIGDIFDKFQQADGSTTREYEGAGLGLSIAKQLTKLMGGDIWAKSEVDKGSSFEIQLSLPIAPEQQISDINRSAFPSSRILIIDDSPLHCQILKEQFSYWNCRSAAVTSAHKGLMALEIAQKRNIKFDLILLDYQFANPRAEDFIEKIRDHSELHNIPVILFTSVTESGLIQHEQFNDRIEFVTKPYNKASLFRAANNLLNRTQSVENNIITLEPLRSIDLDIQMPNSQTQNPTVIDILVAEDNEVNRLYIQYVLDELNVSYKIVEDGQKAARHFLKVSPRLVLMDISMPVLNGYQSTRLIRDIEKRHALQRTPIIAVTAHAMQGSEETCLKADMDGYLSKPLSIETLRQILVKWDILTPEGKEKSALG